MSDVVRLEAYPPVYEGPGGVSLDPVGPEVPDPDEALVLYLLHLRYPGVEFDLPEDPAFHESDPEPPVVRGRKAYERRRL